MKLGQGNQLEREGGKLRAHRQQAAQLSVPLPHQLTVRRAGNGRALGDGGQWARPPGGSRWGSNTKKGPDYESDFLALA